METLLGVALLLIHSASLTGQGQQSARNDLYERWESNHQRRCERTRSQQRRTFSKSSISIY